MFASQTTKDVALPSDPTQTVTIRRLSWLQRRDAQKVSQQQSMRDLHAMGGAEFLTQFKALGEAMGDTAAIVADPLATHDQLTVLVCGITRWSDPTPISKESVSDLDDVDAEFLAREILALSPNTASGADRKNAE